MNITLHRAKERGTADHGWLHANFSFSFADYYNPRKMNFGALRVLNDDYIDGGKGFGTHPHSNMEIITIPLEGALEHKDSEGNSGVIYAGDVQVMSAGTGIYHSEYNHMSDKVTNTLQTWVIPRESGLMPRYDQMSYGNLLKSNSFLQIVSPDVKDDGLWVHQDVWYNIGDFDKDGSYDYTLHMKGNGVYMFIIEGTVDVMNNRLLKRDAIGIWETDSFSFAVFKSARILLIEVPMGY